ncbi:unnamed protein product, partial [Brassica rapa subsp. narinosa]
KLKPAQHSVQGLGLTPDILACRSTKAFEENLEHIFTLFDAPNIWHIPILLDAYKAAKGLRMYSLQRKCNRFVWTSLMVSICIILEAVMITCWLKVLEVSIVTVCLIMLLQIK